MSDLYKSMQVSASGMKAQGTRLRIISENIANADSVSQEPGGAPYRRKMVTFGNELNRELGVEKVVVKNIISDKSDFRREYLPGHPAADADGYILRPNVNSLIEMNDMREAQRSYEANLQAIQASKSMLQRTLEILQ
ncbi:flagellar basal body rod protein FlgC [Kiloniella laminariae]|uniref:Flagellar basal-body rod protein FlgC n=1 Tax=Kiloniella laminariae TaxID=454162 RepID=A0ABT4LHA2_9PROT|nr:flagellar basal body rod protein FlgC [Kiloniella laminariae]MCZ4280476.1 flagellar basal body rod protein FlgC [Kiloniella laminariae]